MGHTYETDGLPDVEPIAVHVRQHPRGSIMRISRYDQTIYLNRDEAVEMCKQITEKLGEMETKGK